MTPVFTFFAVEKGNMTLVEFPNGLNMLVDCRVSATKPSPLQYLKQRIQKLDVLVITHPHHDHLTGLAEICEHYQPKGLWHSGRYFKPDPVFDDWTYYEKLRKGELAFCTPRQVKVGQSIVTGDSRIAILGPSEPFLEGTVDDVNNNGIILSITTGNSHVVITGDTQEEQWSKVDSRALANVSVFLASHHGRESGFSERIMRAMRPQRIIISDGEPADTCAMERYKRFAPVSTTRENNVVVRPSVVPAVANSYK